MSTEFQPFPKMARLSRECVITEKIDGTNASILIEAGCICNPPGNLDGGATAHDGFVVMAGSRKRWITPESDNYGFARWVRDNRTELLKLGPGHHFGEWWGAGIQRRYGLTEKRFSLFNVGRWVCTTGHLSLPGVHDFVKSEDGPNCCHVVPVLYRGEFYQGAWEQAIVHLEINGSIAAPGFRDPEGIVVYHEAGKVGFKKTIINDEKRKSDA